MVKPSGPDALSEGMLEISAKTSDNLQDWVAEIVNRGIIENQSIQVEIRGVRSGGMQDKRFFFVQWAACHHGLSPIPH